MPISCHFRDCKALLSMCSSCNSAISSTWPLPLPFTAAWSVRPSVCLYVCCLSHHSCALLKPLDRMRCHLAETLMCHSSNIVLDRGPAVPQEGKIWGLELGTRSSQRCRLWPNYFGLCWDWFFTLKFASLKDWEVEQVSDESSQSLLQ